jgi:hypothetical protein
MWLRKKVDYGTPAKLLFITPRMDEHVIGTSEEKCPESVYSSAMSELLTLSRRAEFLYNRLFGDRLLTTKGYLLKPKGFYDLEDGFIPDYSAYPNLEQSVYTCNVFENGSAIDALIRTVQDKETSSYDDRVVLLPREILESDPRGLPLLYAVAVKGDVCVFTDHSDPYKTCDKFGQEGWTHPGKKTASIDQVA